MDTTKLSITEAIEAVRDFGEFLHGGEIEDTAQDWLDHGIMPDSEWVDAGVFTPQAQLALIKIGLTPDEVAQSMVDLTGDEGHRFGHERIGYLVSNCDMSAEQALRAIRGEPKGGSPTIEVLSTDYEFPTHDDAEDVSEWEWYGTVWVKVDGVEYEVGCVIGVPESDRGTARAAGGDMVTPYLTAWWGDASDYENAPGDDGSTLDEDVADDVIGAIMEAAPRLWQEARG